MCSIDLLDENLLKTTKYREGVKESLASELLPKVSLQFKWEPPSDDICSSSAAKYFSDQGYDVVEAEPEMSATEELSRRLASFSDLTTTGDAQEILEYLGMVALECSQVKDEYLNGYEYSGEMIRVKNTLTVTAKGFYTPEDVKDIINVIT